MCLINTFWLSVPCRVSTWDLLEQHSTRRLSRAWTSPISWSSQGHWAQYFQLNSITRRSRVTFPQLSFFFLPNSSLFFFICRKVLWVRCTYNFHILFLCLEHLKLDSAIYNKICKTAHLFSYLSKSRFIMPTEIDRVCISRTHWCRALPHWGKNFPCALHKIFANYKGNSSFKLTFCTRSDQNQMCHLHSSITTTVANWAPFSLAVWSNLP